MYDIRILPKTFHYKIGTIIYFDGTNRMDAGFAIVINSYYPTEYPKSEVSYSVIATRPFPQIVIVFMSSDIKHTLDANDISHSTRMPTDAELKLIKELYG